MTMNTNRILTGTTASWSSNGQLERQRWVSVGEPQQSDKKG